MRLPAGQAVAIRPIRIHDPDLLLVRVGDEVAIWGPRRFLLEVATIRDVVVTRAVRVHDKDVPAVGATPVEGDLLAVGRPGHVTVWGSGHDEMDMRPIGVHV